jgi:hypothetical protein
MIAWYLYVSKMLNTHSLDSPFSILLFGWGPLKARNLPGIIQLKSPFSALCNRPRKVFPKKLKQRF